MRVEPEAGGVACSHKEAHDGASLSLMDHEKLKAMAISEAQVRHADGLVFSDEAPEVATTTVFKATFRGHPVRVEFTESETDPAEYRFNAWVFDAETGERITIGNGGEDWQTALAIVHWNDLNSRWPE